MMATAWDEFLSAFRLGWREPAADLTSSRGSQYTVVRKEWVTAMHHVRMLVCACRTPQAGDPPAFALIRLPSWCRGLHADGFIPVPCVDAAPSPDAAVGTRVCAAVHALAAAAERLRVSGIVCTDMDVAQFSAGLCVPHFGSFERATPEAYGGPNGGVTYPTPEWCLHRAKAGGGERAMVWQLGIVMLILAEPALVTFDHFRACTRAESFVDRGVPGGKTAVQLVRAAYEAIDEIVTDMLALMYVGDDASKHPFAEALSYALGEGKREQRLGEFIRIVQ